MGEKVDLHVGGYHLVESVGVGGMGSVFRAVVEAEGKPAGRGTTVAVKLLHPHLRKVEEFVRRFHREAQLAAKIDHPNIARVLEEGIDDRRHYIVMEFAQGLKLSELMQDSQPLSPQQTIEIMNQVCDALNAAEHIDDPEQPGRIRSLVHRDIKPDNVIIQPLDHKQFETMTQTRDKKALANIRVKLLDFGLAKDVKALSTILSQTGQSLGTPAYMSPEQCNGDDVDQRSDIYSLGVCAYQMITGTAPFPGPTTVAYAKQHAEEIPPDILKRNPLCPKNVADCIYRCLAKGPKDRYASPGELQEDLGRVAAGKSVRKVYHFTKHRAISRRKVAAIVAATLVVAVFGAGAIWYVVTDRAKADLAVAVQKADVAIATRDYAAAKKLLEDAVAGFPNRSDKSDLTAPANERLREIAAKAVEQEAAMARAGEEAAKKKHEQDAVSAIADIKAETAAGQYQKAINAANGAIKMYSDTVSAKDFTDLLAAATEKLKDQKAAATAKEEAQRQQLAAEAQAKHDRFIKYRDEGDTAFNAPSPNYSAARAAYEKALVEQDDADIKSRLATCVERTTKQRIAVIDFTEKGQVGIPEAGKTVAELLLTKFGQDRYQLVERSQLDALLKEIDLTIALVRDNPEKAYGKLKGVKYLVLGSVNKLGNITVTARIVDVAKGDVLQTADVSAEDARGIQDAVDELAKVLQMTDGERRASQLMADARAKRQANEFDAAIKLYERALALRDTADTRSELASCRDEEILRQKDRAFTALIERANTILSTLPANIVPDSLSQPQKDSASDGVEILNQALMIKLNDATATLLRRRLAAYSGNKVVMQQGPPPAVLEVVPTQRPSGSVWLCGFYEFENNHYVWKHGRFEKPPHAGATYTSPRWEHTELGYEFSPGFWR